MARLATAELGGNTDPRAKVVGGSRMWLLQREGEPCTCPRNWRDETTPICILVTFAHACPHTGAHAHHCVA